MEVCALIGIVIGGIMIPFGIVAGYKENEKYDWSATCGPLFWGITILLICGFWYVKRIHSPT